MIHEISHIAPEQPVSDELLPLAIGMYQDLRELPVLQQLNPTYYLPENLEVERYRDIMHPDGLPVDVVIDKKRKVLTVRTGNQPFEYYEDEYAHGDSEKARDLTKLFIGYAMVHDLAFRALRPERTPGFIDDITKPNGLFTDLLESRLIDDNQHANAIQEFITGDEDRIAQVNVARFAVGAVCEAVAPSDPGFRPRILDIFRSELGNFLDMRPLYLKTAENKLRQDPKRAQEMFVEHIKIFDLAAAFPKNAASLERFAELY